MKTLVINPKNPMYVLTMNNKMNLYVLILWLFLTQLIVGCGGTRSGVFFEVGGGIAAVAANEEWIAHTYQEFPYEAGTVETLLSALALSNPRTTTRSQIGMTHRSANVTAPSPLAYFKFGYGFSDKLLVSYRGTGTAHKLSVIGIGFTYFAKKTVPSLYFDIFLPLWSGYYFSNIQNFGPFEGRSASIGVGYEWKKNWNAQVDFNYGVYGSNDIGARFSDVIEEPHPNAIRTYTTDERKRARVYSLGFTIGYIWY